MSSGGGSDDDKRRSGRERVRAQQIQQAAAARRRRQLLIGGIVAAVIVVAVGVGLLVQHNTANNNKAARAAYGAGQPFSAPTGSSANPASAKDPGGILYGSNLQAKVTLQIWEDVRCPYCKIAEDMLGDTYRGYADAGKIKVEFHLVDLIDRVGGGQGSLVGGSSLACAQDVSFADFMAYHNLFYKDQPKETTDSFGSVTNVLNLAGQVQGLRGAAFDACATDGKYAPWVKANYDALSAKLNGSPGTPDFYIDGTPFTIQDTTLAPPPQQQAALKAALDAAIAKQG